MKNNITKKILALVSVICLSTTALTGCGDDKSAGNVDEKVSYSMFAHNWQVYDGAEKDSIIKTLEDKFGMELNLTGASSEGWIEKLTLMINTNEIPDLFFFLPSKIQYREWIENDLILPLNDYLDDAPYIKNIFDDKSYKNLSVNGKYYFVPKVSLQNSHTMYVRKDWVDKTVGKMPETLDEFTEMLRAFTEDDPDGNGKNDTYGLSISKVSGWLSGFYSTFGLKPNWNKHGENYEPYYMQNGYKEMLAWLNSMYKKGYIQQEYYLNTDQQKLETFYSGKAGMTLHNGGSFAASVISQTQLVNENAVIDAIAPPSNGKNEGAMAAFGGFYGGWNISGKAPSPEKAVELLNYISSPEGQELITYGIKDYHYTMEGDTRVFNYDNCVKEPNEVFRTDNGKVVSLYKIGEYFATYELDGDRVKAKRDYTFDKAPELAAKTDYISNNKLNISDTINIIDMDEEFTEISTKLNDIVEKYSIQIISGQLDVDEGFEKMKNEIKKSNYTKAQQLMEESMENIEK